MKNGVKGAFNRANRIALAIVLTAGLVLTGQVGYAVFAQNDAAVSASDAAAEAAAQNDAAAPASDAAAEAAAQNDAAVPASDAAAETVAKNDSAVSASDAAANAVAKNDSAVSASDAEAEVFNNTTSGSDVSYSNLAPVTDNNGNSYESLVNAVANAPSGSSLTLNEDAVGSIIIPVGKTLTINLNGKSIMCAATEAGTSAVITNNGTLTINGSGTVTTEAYHPDTQAIPGYANNVITNCGAITINGGNYINCTTSGGACFALDNQSTSREVTATINNGYFKANSSAIRMFCNSTTYGNTLTFNNGTVLSGGYGIWMQHPNSSAVKGSLNINGGDITSKNGSDPIAVYAYAPSGANCSQMFVNITGGTFNGGARYGKAYPASNLSVSGGYFIGDYTCYSYLGSSAQYITGGRFSGTYAAYCAYYQSKSGYTYFDLGDGTYLVAKYTPVTVSPDAGQYKYVDKADPKLTYTASVSGLEFVGELERAEGETAGEYAISYGTLDIKLDTDQITYPYSGYTLPLFTNFDDSVVFTIKEREYVPDPDPSTVKTDDGAVSAEGDAVLKDDNLELVTEELSTAEEESLEDKLENNEQFIFVEDVHFELNGEEIDYAFEGTIDVTFNVGTQYNGRKAKVWHCKADSSYESWDDIVVTNGKVTVTVRELSPFGVIIKGVKSTASSGSAGDKTGDDLNMGIIIVMVALFILSAAVDAIIIIKRRARFAFAGAEAIEAEQPEAEDNSAAEMITADCAEEAAEK